MENNPDKVTEQQFLDMAKDCMERVNQKNQEIKMIKKQREALISKVIEIYGCYKKLTKYIYHLSHIDETIDFLVREIDSDLREILYSKPPVNIEVDLTLNIETLPEDTDDER